MEDETNSVVENKQTEDTNQINQSNEVIAPIEAIQTQPGVVEMKESSESESVKMDETKIEDEIVKVVEKPVEIESKVSEESLFQEVCASFASAVEAVSQAADDEIKQQDNDQTKCDVQPPQTDLSQAETKVNT